MADKSPNIDVIDERTNVNTKDISKIFKCLFGANGKDGGLVGEVRNNKSNIGWVKWLLVIQIAALVGNFIRMSFSITF